MRDIAVRLGSDHQLFAENGAILTGIDLTERAIELVRSRFELFGLHSDPRLADCENLPFEDASFDPVYSWCILHHTPNIPKAVAAVHRVLRPGGEPKIMVN